MVNAHNKRGTAGSTLLREWPMARQGESFEVPAAPLWAALCAQGGLHLVRLPAWQCHAWPPVQVLLAGHSARQVRRRGPVHVLSAVRSIPGLEGFPPGLAGTVMDRIDTWLLPMYGRSEAEELGTLAPAELSGAHPAVAPCRALCMLPCLCRLALPCLHVPVPLCDAMLRAQCAAGRG